MPNFNGTGPMGQGPMTGGGMGKCGEGEGDFAPGDGMGMGRGMRGGMGIRGRGICRGQNANYTPEQEKTALQNEVSNLKAMLKNAEDRLKSLEE